MRPSLFQRLTSTLICSTLFLGALSPAIANSPDEGPIYFESPYGQMIFNRPIPGEDFQKLLREHLNRLRKPDDHDPENIHLFESAYDFTLGFISSLQGVFTGLCSEGDNKKATCMKDYLAELIEAALSTGAIDLIEAKCLSNNIHYLVYRNGKYDLDVGAKPEPTDGTDSPTAPLSPKKLKRLQNKTDRKNRRAQKAKYPHLPMLTEYEIKKNFFRLVREHKHDEQISLAQDSLTELNARLANTTDEYEKKSLEAKIKVAEAELEYRKKAPIHLDVKTQRLTIGTYKRKVKTVGRVSPIESLIVRFDRTQINKMSGLMKDYISRMTAQAAMIVFMKRDYTQINVKIDRLLQENIKLLTEKSKITDPTDVRIKEIDGIMSENLKAIDALEADKFADQLKKEISDKQEELEKKMKDQLDQVLTQAQLKSLRFDLSKTQSEIDALKKKLKEECIEVPLDHPDIYRASSRILKLILAEVKATDPTLSKITLGDVVAAGYLTGDVDVNLFRAVLTLKEMQEPYDNILKKIGNIIFGLAKTVLGAIPVTAPFVAVVSLVIDSVKQVKEYRNAMANETHIF